MGGEWGGADNTLIFFHWPLNLLLTTKKSNKTMYTKNNLWFRNRRESLYVPLEKLKQTNKTNMTLLLVQWFHTSAVVNFLTLKSFYQSSLTHFFLDLTAGINSKEVVFLLTF